MSVIRLWTLLVSVPLLLMLLSRHYTTAHYEPPTWLNCDQMAQALSPVMASVPQPLPTTTTTITTTTLQLVTHAYGGDCWRAYLPVLAAEQLPDPPLHVETRALQMLSGAYRREIVRAIAAGSGPDIAFAGPREIATWGKAGYIMPLDDCIASEPAFAQVDPQLWSVQRWDGHLWGVPLHWGAHLLYYHKPTLQRLGWSPAQIAALPEQIRVGEFRLADLELLAQQAIAADLIQPGFGVWPDENRFDFWQLIYSSYGGDFYDPTQDRIVIDPVILTESFAYIQQLLAEDLMLRAFASNEIDAWVNNVLRRDATVAGQVLFWFGRMDDRAEWRYNYAEERGGEPYLDETIGVALIPAAQPGQPGFMWSSLAGYYVILTQEASGRALQQQACGVLAATLQPEIHLRHIIHGGHLSVLTQDTASLSVEIPAFTEQTAAMRPYLRPGSQIQSQFFLWFDQDAQLQAIILGALAQAERGELSPSTAAAKAVAELERLLGDKLVVK